MIQRIHDWLHERAIKRQSRLFQSLSDNNGSKSDIRREYAKLAKMVLARSPAQVARQERAIWNRMDEHARMTFERSRNQQ